MAGEALNFIEQLLSLDEIGQNIMVDGDFGNTVGGFVVTNVGVAFGAVLPFDRRVKHVFIRIDHRVSFVRRRSI